MKKLLTIFIILFLFTVNLQAEEEPLEKTHFSMKRRTVEFGFANVDFGIANNLIKFSDLFKPKMVLDFSKLDKNFNLGFDVNVRPFFININIKNRWGLGFDFGNTKVYGSLDIASNLLNLRHSEKGGDSFGVGASVFVDVGIPVFFKIKNVWETRDLRINIRPAFFVAAAYMSPSMKYTYRDGDKGTLIEIDYGITAYAPFSLDFGQGGLNNLNIGSALGFDFSVGADYPLFKFLDIGVQFINIPLKSSVLENYLKMSGKVSVDSSDVTIEDLINNTDNAFGKFVNLPDGFTQTYGSNSGKRFYRPFKMLFTANYRPFTTPILFISPTFGFSYNQIFVKKAAVEFGVKVGCNLANIFTTTIGVCYEDKMWKNGIDFLLNLYAFELGFGVAMQSQHFVQSWQGKGLRANVSIKFGF